MKAKKGQVSPKKSSNKSKRTTKTVKRLIKKSKADNGIKNELEKVEKETSKQTKKISLMNANGRKGTSSKKIKKVRFHSQTKVRNNVVDNEPIQLRKSLRKNDFAKRTSEKDDQIKIKSVKITTNKKSNSVMVTQETAQSSDNDKQRKTRKRTSSDVEPSESKRRKVENQDPNKQPKPRSSMRKGGNSSKSKTNNIVVGKVRGKQRKGSPGKSTTSDFNPKETPQRRVTRLALLQSKGSHKKFINETEQKGVKKEVQSNILKKKATGRKLDIPKQIKPGVKSLKLPKSNKTPTINSSEKRDKGRSSKKITFYQEVENPVLSTEDSFSNKGISLKAKESLKNKRKKKPKKFLDKFKLIKKIESSPQKPVHGLSLSRDNLMWVNILNNTVKLVDSEGHIFKMYDTTSPPVFNACTAEGDLLFTSGCAGSSRSNVYRIRREAEPTISIFADLSEFGEELFGLHVTKNGHVFVLALRENKTKIVELSPDGKIQHCYCTNSFKNHIIEINGQLRVIETSSGDMFPLPDGSEGEDKIALSQLSGSFYSASASVDRFEHILIGCSESEKSIWIFDHLGKHLHTLPVNECTTENIISTATDNNDNIWFGTYSGTVFIGKYLQNT